MAVTMVPALGLIHYGWYALQNVDSLVREDERKEHFPIVDVSSFSRLETIRLDVSLIFQFLSKLTHGGAKNMDSNIRQFRHQAD